MGGADSRGAVVGVLEQEAAELIERLRGVDRLLEALAPRGLEFAPQFTPAVDEKAVVDLNRSEDALVAADEHADAWEQQTGGSRRR